MASKLFSTGKKLITGGKPLTASKFDYKREIDIKYLKQIERRKKIRKADLERIELKDWIRKLDSLLAVSKKGTVHEIKEKLFKELFKREITSIKVGTVDSNLQAREYSYLHGLFTSDFYNILHSSFVPTSLQNMSAKDAINFIENVSKKAKSRTKSVYKEFRKNYVI